MPTDRDFLRRLLEILERETSRLAPRGYCIAWSGGLDSTLLLASLAGATGRLAAPLRAVHVEHGLSPRAGRWAAHCAREAGRRAVPLVHRAVRVARDDPRGLEAAAREARYAVLAEVLEPGEVLLTAHHQDDQLETLLLQLCRGAGLGGLAAMPRLRRFAAGWHCRPLLDFGRAELEREADELGLDWIEDDSNQDRSLDRNFLRAVVVPALRERWPALGANLARAARHCAEALQLLDDYSAADLTRLCDGERLAVERLAELAPARRRLLLRHWLADRGLPTPSARQLEQIERVAANVRGDAEPCVRWPGAELRRYRGHLYAGAPLPDPPEDTECWDGRSTLDLGPWGRLRLEPNRVGGIDPRVVGGGLAIRFRRGGERIRPAGAVHHRALKKLFQEAGVPPWLRARVPLLYSGDVLAAVADLWVADACAARPGDPALRVVWQDRPF